MSKRHTACTAYVGAQNDALYIVLGEPPATTNDHPRHDADRTAIAKVYDQVDARRLAACWNACHGMGTESLEKIVTVGETIASLLKLRDDTKHQSMQGQPAAAPEALDWLIVEWLVRNHTLHRQVKATYVVDGYEVEITHDGWRIAGPWCAPTLRGAYIQAMQSWDKTHGDKT